MLPMRYHDRNCTIVSLADLTEVKLAAMRMEILTEIAEYDIKSEDDFYLFVVDKILNITNSGAGCLYQYDEDNHTYTLRSLMLNIQPEPITASLNYNCTCAYNSIWAEVARTKKTIVSNEYKDLMQYGPKDMSSEIYINNILALPVMYGGKLEYILGIANRENGYMIDDEAHLTIMMDAAFKKIRLHQNAKEIEQSRDTAELVFETAPIPLHIYDVESKEVITANKAFMEFVGADNYDMLLEDQSMIADESVRRMIAERLECDGYIDGIEIKINKTSLSEPAWIYANYKIIEFQGRKCCFVGFTDLTEIREAQEKVKYSEFRQTQAAYGAGLGLWTLYVDSGAMEINTIWCTQLQYNPEDLRDGDEEWGSLKGGVSGWKALLHPDDYSRVTKALDDYVDGITGEYREEYRLRCKDGSYLWTLSRGTKIEESDGSIQLTGVHVAIDKLKKTQRQLEIARLQAEKGSKR